MTERKHFQVGRNPLVFVGDASTDRRVLLLAEESQVDTIGGGRSTAVRSKAIRSPLPTELFSPKNILRQTSGGRVAISGFLERQVNCTSVHAGNGAPLKNSERVRPREIPKIDLGPARGIRKENVGSAMVLFSEEEIEW
ncbi:MAG: hypothetical protein QME66_04755 [Candidatus Eisenbacteria bacterium]|nr:hypothetical protein [Candidatus Eisenbacteria bacterium]